MHRNGTDGTPPECEREGQLDNHSSKSNPPGDKHFTRRKHHTIRSRRRAVEGQYTHRAAAGIQPNQIWPVKPDDCINKWIKENKAKEVAVENVGILLVLTTDAWFKVYGWQAFGKSAQRELVAAANQGKIGEKLEDFAQDWLSEEITGALAKQEQMFLLGVKWERERATNQDRVEMIDGMVLMAPFHERDMRLYVTSPLLCVDGP